MARRFGSAMISKTDSTALYIPHIAYTCQGIYRQKKAHCGVAAALEAATYINHLDSRGGCEVAEKDCRNLSLWVILW